MSEEIKTEPEEDEENFKTTPVRESMRDYEETNGQTDDEQGNELATTSHTFANDKESKVVSEDFAVEVKTEPEDGVNIAQEHVIEKLVAGTASGQDGPKTPERFERNKSQDITRNENEAVGIRKLFDDSVSIDETIGKLCVHIKPSLNQEDKSENRQIRVNKEIIKEKFADTNINTQEATRNEPVITNSITEVPISSPCKTENPLTTLETGLETPQQEKNQHLAKSPANTDKTPNKETTRPNNDSDKTPIKEKSTNSTLGETSNIQVKTEPEMDKNNTIDFDEAIGRLSSLETNTETVETNARIVPNTATNEIPEIPVKTEPNENISNEPMDFEATIARPSNSKTEAPPPQPSISAPRIRDSDTDGISTPRISVAPMSRLRVKTELSLFQTPTPSNVETSSLPQDFFEDLLTLNNPSESGELTPNNSEDARSQDEPIPDNFFDDLLRDQLKERIEEARNNDLEEKYSDRLKELERLENELKRLDEKSRERKKNHKKQKKSKKKSHKRSRSKSPSHISREKERDRHRRSPSPYQSKKKRARVSPSPPTFQQPHSTSNYGNLNKVTASRVAGLQVKSEFCALDVANENIINCDLNDDVEMIVTPIKIEPPPPPPVVDCEEIVEFLTPKQKIERAKQRACTLISHLKNMSVDSALSTFQFTSTVRKLPASHSYVHQHIYENRSPLHTVNNVNYKFNSHSTRFNMEEWGLATLPPQAAKIAKIVGCDAKTIHHKLKSIKIPAKLQKTLNGSSNNQGEELDETTSSFFCNAMTQTDEIEELTQRKTKGYEIGVQVEPSICNIGCQTLETQSPTKNSQSDPDEVPIMKIMRDLNENQLMAIHDFAELIKEPAANAMDMYSLRMRMLEIYKCSQLPSALATTQSQVINNYTTSSPRNSPQTHRRSAPVQQPIIQSVSAADGSHFSINDPRAKSAAYTSRVGSGRGSSISSSTNYDPRFSTFTQQPGNRTSSSLDSRNYSGSASSSSRQPPSSNHPQPPTSATAKYYGRGGLRRQ